MEASISTLQPLYTHVCTYSLIVHNDTYMHYIHTVIMILVNMLCFCVVSNVYMCACVCENNDSEASGKIQRGFDLTSSVKRTDEKKNAKCWVQMLSAHCMNEPQRTACFLTLNSNDGARGVYLVQLFFPIVRLVRALILFKHSIANVCLCAQMLDSLSPSNSLLPHLSLFFFFRSFVSTFFNCIVSVFSLTQCPYFR